MLPTSRTQRLILPQLHQLLVLPVSPLETLPAVNFVSAVGSDPR
ncbi:unnamed protein product [Musa textilis]